MSNENLEHEETLFDDADNTLNETEQVPVEKTVNETEQVPVDKEDVQDGSAGDKLQFSYVNKNVEGGQWPFSPLDKSKGALKYQTSLGVYNNTPEEIAKLADNPYLKQDDAEFDDKWGDAVSIAEADQINATFFGDSLNREGSHWHPKVEYEGQRLGPSSPRVGTYGKGEKIAGIHAIRKIQALTGGGGMVKVPLWHSGFYISIKAPTDMQLLNYHDTVAREKIELGKNTVGLIFSNSSSYTNSSIYDLAVDCIYETSVKDCSIGDIKEILSINDFPIIAWALAYTMYPNGYSYVSPCIADPKNCQAVTEALLDIRKLLWVDRTALNEKQKRHMSQYSDSQCTRADVKAYQDEFDNTDDNTYVNDLGFTVAFKQPTLKEHLESGARWIHELDNVVRDVFTEEVRQDRINAYINNRANLTKLRSFTHYIKHVTWHDDDSITVAEETIERLMDQFSANPDIIEDLGNKLDKYIDKSSIAIVGLPRVPCPKCGKTETTDEAKANPWIIPINPVRLFFRLRDRKLQQSIPT